MIDGHLNAGDAVDGREITTVSESAVLVIKRREDLDIARQAQAVLERPAT